MAKVKREEMDGFSGVEEMPRIEACIGLPVQYHTPRETLPAVLQRRGIVNPDLWDLKVSLSGATSDTTRSAVAYSETPKPGCWSFLPGFGG